MTNNYIGNQNAKKAESESKIESIYFRVTSSEKAIFVGFAKSHKMSLTEFMREAANQFISSSAL